MDAPATTATQYLAPISGEQLKTWLSTNDTATAGYTIEDAVVKVWQGNRGGSGTVVGRAADGSAVVLSAAHVFTDTGPAQVVLRDGTKFSAYVYDLDRRADVAILAATVPLERPVVCVPIAEKCPEPGAVAIKLGYPAYAGGALDGRWGTVAAKRASSLFNANLYVRSGDSGGGVFSEDGKLISVVSGYVNEGGHLYGSGTEALHAMVDKHGYGRCIFGRLRDNRDGKDRPGLPKPKEIIKKLFPKPPKDEPEKPVEKPAEPIRPPQVDLKPIQDEIAALRKEIAAIKSVPGPAGPAGKDADQAWLVGELEKLRSAKFIAELLNDKGEIKQRVSFGVDQPLRLKLVPVQPMKP